MSEWFTADEMAVMTAQLDGRIHWCVSSRQAVETWRAVKAIIGMFRAVT